MRYQQFPQFSWCVMGKSQQLCHHPHRINTPAVRFYAENNSMKEFMWSIERDMIQLLYIHHLVYICMKTNTTCKLNTIGNILLPCNFFVLHTDSLFHLFPMVHWENIAFLRHPLAVHVLRILTIKMNKVLQCEHGLLCRPWSSLVYGVKISNINSLSIATRTSTFNLS